jgi:hypothetical protein
MGVPTAIDPSMHGNFGIVGPGPDEWAAYMTAHSHEHLSPDCAPGDFKHRACVGDAWCDQLDQGVDCDCACHLPAMDEPSGSGSDQPTQDGDRTRP